MVTTIQSSKESLLQKHYHHQFVRGFHHRFYPRGDKFGFTANLFLEPAGNLLSPSIQTDCDNIYFEKVKKKPQKFAYVFMQARTTYQGSIHWIFHTK